MPIIILRICAASLPPRRSPSGLHRTPKPPLCKGRWHGAAVPEGLCAGSVEPRPAGERIAASLRSSQSTCFYECITVNETCVCRARPLGVPFAGSCIPFNHCQTARRGRRALRLLLFLSNDRGRSPRAQANRPAGRRLWGAAHPSKSVRGAVTSVFS